MSQMNFFHNLFVDMKNIGVLNFDVCIIPSHNTTKEITEGFRSNIPLFTQFSQVTSFKLCHCIQYAFSGKLYFKTVF